MKTIADVVRDVASGAFAYSHAYRKKVLGSLRRCDRHPLFEHAPLARIPADPKAFTQRVGRGAVHRVPAGFDTPRQYRRWRSEVLGVLKLAAGQPVRIVVEDDWTRVERELMALLETCQHRQEFHRIGLRTLARHARDRHWKPSDLTQARLESLLEGCVSRGESESLRSGVRDLETWRQLTGDPDLFELVPPPSRTSRRQTPPLPAALLGDIERHFAGRREAVFEGIEDRPTRLADSTIARDRNGIQWLVSAANSLGLVDLPSITSGAAFASPELLNRCAFAEMNGELGWDPVAAASLKGYIKSAACYLLPYNAEIAAARNALLDLAFFESASGMSPMREAWCRELIRSPEKTRRFLMLPSIIFADARERWRSFISASRVHQAQILAVCTAAATAAVLGSLPLRANTLLKLGLEGREPEVLLPSRSSSVIIRVPAALMKNKKEVGPVDLIPKPGGSPREILDFFVSGPREELIRRLEERGKAEPALLFGGLAYGRLQEWWTRIVAVHGLAMTLHMMRHGIASILLNRDSNNIGCVAALLEDSPSTVFRHYAFIDKLRRHEEAQRKLAETSVGHALTVF